MGLRKSQPLHFSPVGCSDALDSTNVSSGMMQSLQNLIPDPTTRNLWQCRSAATRIANFNLYFVQPVGFISALLIIGDRAYGMITTGNFPGHDIPFCYDLKHAQIVFIANITAANTPASASPTGDWVPPTMAMIGTKIVVTHPGFSGLGGIFFGWIDASDPTALSWNAGNTAPNQLIFPPTAVEQFGNRAYFIVNPPRFQPAVYFSDVLNATVITNANQILTFGDNQRLTALGGLPLSNQLGGVIQSLMVFKGNSNIYQVTGDYALNTLSLNTLNVATGTLAPNSITTTPRGLIFLAPEGLRLIDFDARISDPIGEAGQGVTVPFIYSQIPSRVNAAANADVIRISTYNNFLPNAPAQEWWYDMTRQCWHGPHTFPASMIAPYNNTFIMTPIGVNGGLWQSDPVQNSGSTFVENGVQMTFSFITSMLPDTEKMCEHSMIETTANIALTPLSGSVVVSAYNEFGFPLNQVTLTPQGGTTIWNQFNWGQALWGGPQQPLFPQQVNWTWPIVFRRLAFGVGGNCGSGLKLGDVFFRYEELGYLTLPQTLGTPLGNWQTLSHTADNTLSTADNTFLTADAA